MRKGIYILPNSLTLCGMLFGFSAILAAHDARFAAASWGIIIASVFDGLDGWVARLTHTTTRFGIELDSLSDLVAFGVAPAVLLHAWCLNGFGRLGWAAAFLYVGCGALRLARFNVQMGSAESKAFTGMPIPGAAGIVAATVLFSQARWGGPPAQGVLILVLAFALAMLMVSTLRYHGAKELNLRKRKPFSILVLFAVCVVLVVSNPPVVLFTAGMLYMAWGIAESLYLKMKKRKTHPRGAQ